MSKFNSIALFFKFKSSLLFGLILAIFFNSCGPTRHLEENQKLLTKVTIKNVDGGEDRFNDELVSLAKQQPNRKFLGAFKIYLGIYNLFYHKEDSKIKEKIGEPPVIYDSTQDQKSVLLMNQYLNNRGYYQNEVKSKTKLTKKKAKTTYLINKGERFYLRSIKHKIDNPRIENLILSESKNMLIKENSPFDVERMKKERERIERLLKNNGYYKFSREYIRFEVDTSMNRHEANMTITIQKPQEEKVAEDTIIKKEHLTYQISRVIVRNDYSFLEETTTVGDTSRVDSIVFIDYKTNKFQKAILAQIITIRPGELYKLSSEEQTYRNLSAQRIFSSVNIHYETDYRLGEGNLILFIDLTTRKKMSYTIQSEGTNNGGNLGINGTVNFQNNNTLRGAEVLNISLNGGLEAQRILTDDVDPGLDRILGFNTFEFGPRLSLEVPRFLLPFSNKRFSTKSNPKTTFNASFNYQERPDYTRNVTETYIAYSWNQSPTKTHIIQPFDLSYAKLDLSPAFQRLLNEIQNPFLRNSYTDNLIMALKYSFIYNSKSSNKLKNYTYFRVNVESAGNTLALASNPFNQNQNEDGSYNIAKIRYAQYIRSDFDFRYFQNFDFNQLVYRFAAGLGLPYDNSIVMPFEKSFYAGGANNIRAWRIRELGPGTLSDSLSQSADQIGNMRLEFNLELRFPVTNLLEGAAFLDAGNIWNLNQNDNREETQFAFDRLWDGTAIGLGLGVRLNFTFFILRLDFATPFKDPAKVNPNLIKPQWDRINLNLGIGYPF